MKYCFSQHACELNETLSVEIGNTYIINIQLIYIAPKVGKYFPRPKAEVNYHYREYNMY